MAFKIDSNIPMPQFSGGRGSNNPKYPFCSMKIGDSFLIPKELEYETRDFFVKRIKNRIHGASAYYRESHNSKARFLCAWNGIGVRVWRTE